MKEINNNELQVAYETICQTNNFEHCKNTLETFLSDVFENISFDDLNYQKNVLKISLNK